MFWRVGNEIGCFEHFVTKKQRFGFSFLNTLFSSLIVAKIRFCMLATKSRCFEFYVTKKSVFAFSLLKHVGLSFIAQHMFGLKILDI